MKATMKVIPAFILSFCRFASSPASVVEAFQLSWTRTTTALSLRRPHRIDPSPSPKLMSQSPAKSSQIKTREMKNSSLNADPSNGDASSSPSILDFLVTKIGSTTSMVVAGTFFVVLCYKRDALMVSFFLGSISNAIFGKVLKKILKIERPDVALSQDVPEIDQPSDNGMPSSHAMSLGFICTFVALLLPNTTIPLAIYSAISLIYRVRVNLHTVDQIAVGAILGTFDGAVWWHLCTKGFRGFNVVEMITATGMINESGQLHWYLLAFPLLVGAAVVGSVERRLGKYFGSGSSSNDNDSNDPKQA